MPVHEPENLIEQQAKECRVTTPMRCAFGEPRRHLSEWEENQPDDEEAPMNKYDRYAKQRESGKDEEPHSIP